MISDSLTITGLPILEERKGGVMTVMHTTLQIKYKKKDERNVQTKIDLC